MKPHEESWTVEENDNGEPTGVRAELDRGPNPLTSVVLCAAYANGAEGRIRLAARAPAMARLLLEMLEPARSPKERLAWALAFEPRLVSVLRAAGVLQ